MELKLICGGYNQDNFNTNDVAYENCCLIYLCLPLTIKHTYTPIRKKTPRILHVVLLKTLIQLFSKY